MQDSEEIQARRAVIDAARELNSRGINVNKSGNVSVRVPGGFLITPTGIPYETLAVGDIVFVDLESGEFSGKRLPSSEWEMHAEVYRARPDAGAVAHCHSAYATALACQNMRIPAFHYMVAAAGGDSIEVAPYETFGTKRLAVRAAEALRKRNACLLEHHGSLALGRTLAKAVSLLAEVENLARQYCIVRSLGEPRLIPADEMARVARKFKTYGRQPGDKE